MTLQPLKPWSQFDDEPDEYENPAAPTKRHDSDEAAASGRCAAGVVRGLSENAFFAKCAPYLALAPLAAAAVWLLWGAIRPAGGPVLQAVVGFLLLAAAAALVFLSQSSRRASLANLREGIDVNGGQLSGSVLDKTLGPELQPIWEAVEHHFANIEGRMAELQEERQQLALELRLAETQKRQAQAILDSISDPVLVSDAFDRLVLANPAAEELFNFKQAESLRKPIAELLNNDKLVRTIHRTGRAAGQAARRRTEHEIDSRVFAVTLSPVTSETDSCGPPAEHHGVVVVLRDVTRAREAARMKSDFVSHVAHELRTPLSSIKAYVEMLVDGEAADEQTQGEYYDIIQTSADRLARLIDNMLNISRIEAGTVRINKEPVALTMVVKEAIDTLRPQAEEKKIILTEDLPPLAYRVMADRDMIHQAVLNLLSNAIKYTPAGGKVHVKVSPREEDRTICVDVSDTGVGIPKEDLPRMFEKFFRVEANKKMAKGTGLGLSLVKHIVETVHDGRMTLSSEIGKGSTFGMVLPMMS